MLKYPCWESLSIILRFTATSHCSRQIALHLDLSNNVHMFGLCIFNGLEHNTTLCHLDLHAVSSVIYIHGDTTAKRIARVLKSNCSLQTLNIVGWRFLGRNGIHPILESLMFNSTLQTLHISDIDSETLSTFKRAREAKNLPPINVVLSDASDYSQVIKINTYIKTISHPIWKSKLCALPLG